MKNILLAVTVVLTLVGCAEIPRLTEADAATWGERFNDEFACKAAGGDRYIDDLLFSERNKETMKHNQSLWVKEVQRRGLLNESDWKLVSEKKIGVGMSQCALYLSWGKPTKENKSVYGNGVHIQHIYENNQYVYTENGKVTSWQSSN